jgi:hypothetical protein
MSSKLGALVLEDLAFEFDDEVSRVVDEVLEVEAAMLSLTSRE